MSVGINHCVERSSA